MDTTSWQIFPGTTGLAVLAVKLFGRDVVNPGFSWMSPVIVHDQSSEEIQAFVDLVNERLPGHYFTKF